MTQTCVLHVLAAPASGGAETFARDLCIALKGRDWAPHIAFISQARDLGRDEGYQAAFLARLDAGGVGHAFLGHECRSRPWLGALRLRRLAARLGVDLIHSHLAYGNAYALASPRMPLVYTHHSAQPRFSPAVYWCFRQRVDAWVGISQGCAAVLERHSGRPVSLIRNAIDLTRFSGVRRRQPDMPLRAMAVGRLSAQKDYPLLAEALRRVEARGPGRIKVDVFGEGDPAIVAQCAEILAEAPAGLMRFAGASRDIAGEMAARSLFLMSSAWEGMPVSLIEATASGLPAVVTDVGGCRELIEQCGSGLVVPQGHPAALADAIETMLRNPERLATMSAQALRHASDFGIDAAADAHARLYREALS